MNNPRVVILSHSDSAETDRRLKGIITFAGLDSLVLSVDKRGDADAALQRIAKAEPTFLMSSAHALASFFHQQSMAWNYIFQSPDPEKKLFVYGFSPGELQIKLAKNITRGAVSSVLGSNGAPSMYQVTASYRDMTQEFSGLSFGPIDPQTDFAFVVAENTRDISRFILIRDFPHFLSVKLPTCTLFLSACTGVADIQREIQEDSYGMIEAANYFSKLVPALMFLRHCFGPRCWHSPRKFARFIIDDPPLQKSYGFLRFDRLLESTAKTKVGISLSFIPWNYRRTSSSVVNMFRQNALRLSLCIHGCDHTQGEFAITEEGQLNLSVILGIRRMNYLAQQTDLSYENVMVCPQGKFSTQALKVLKCNNILGAINSFAIPRNRVGDHGLRVADFLTPAVTRFHGFPVFLRRSPGDVANFAWDLFFNKPAFVVEHHRYFKNGYGKLRELAEKLNGLNSELQWSRLDHILAHTQLQRRVTDGVIQCRIFANSQVIENFSDAPEIFIVSKTEPDVPLIEDVAVDGKRQEFEVHDTDLSFQTRIAPYGSVHVSVLYRNTFPPPKRKRGRAYASRVFLRRHLSELRDHLGFLLHLPNQLGPMRQPTRY